MIKVIIFSDSHGDFSTLDNAINHYKPDRIFGLGDYDANIIELNLRGIIGVKGNSYFDPDLEYDHFFSLCGFNFLLTHGHTHSVRSSLISLKYFSKEKNVNIAFYGHTHVASIKEDEGIYFINPGSTTKPYLPNYPTLVYMEIDEGLINLKIVDASIFTVFKEVVIKK